MPIENPTEENIYQELQIAEDYFEELNTILQIENIFRNRLSEQFEYFT